MSNSINTMQDKGGTCILAYAVTVLIGSIPFIAFLTWRAGTLGLNRRNAFLATLFLSGTVMVFPWALRSGWIYIWMVSIIAFFILMVLWPGILVGSLGDAVAAPEIEKASAEEPIESEEGWTAGEEGLEGKLISTDGYEIEELIDLGFREKNAENAKQAAAYFFQALKQDPEPDLAFSLIMECMDLWGKLGKRDFALDELQTYIQKYLLLFDKDLHFHFYTWMVKEKIQMI